MIVRYAASAATAITRVPPNDFDRARGALAAFLANLRSPETIRAYRNAARSFWRFCEDRACSPIAASRLHAIAWRDWLIDAGLSVATVTQRLAGCSSLYAEMVRAGAIDRNPFEAIRRPSGAQHGARALDMAELHKLVEACRADRTLQGQRDEALILLLFHAGLRRSEAAKLRVADIVVDQGRKYVRVVGKGSKQRDVLLHEEASAAIDRWIGIGAKRAGDAIFPLAARGNTLTAAMVWKIVSRRAKHARLTNVRPHGLRATFATAAFDANVPIRDVQAAMGHASPTVTGRYDRSKTRGNAAVAALPRVG